MNINSSLIGKIAPDFNASAVVNGKSIVENFNLMQYDNHYILLIFYPKDFTFVCPTELHAFQEKIDEFDKRNVKIIAISIDSEYSHLTWLKIPKKNGGIKGINYPIVSDINKTISYSYGVLSGKYFFDEKNMLKSEGNLIAYRGLFLIDKSKIIRHQLINDFPLGRDVNEAIRIIDALQNFEKSGEVCPANWNKNKKSIKPNYEELCLYYNK